ncbi:MAG: hypothetical protein FVQ82_00315 [Planctomycetes bacterium]|nr:hypothetical protein [Planctomycetota bacterium]
MVNTLKRVLYFASLLSVVALTGCPPPRKPLVLTTFDSMVNIEAAAAALELHKANVKPLRANASVEIIFFKDGKEKKEHPDASLAFDPPKRLFFRAKRLGIEVIWVGSNDEEFWFRMKPKEISQYFWGLWTQLDGCSSNLLVSPESMLDALGMVSVDSSWLLRDLNGQDVLVKYGDNNRVNKKIFVSRKGYLVSRIEYYDKYGIMTASVDMGDYRPIDDGSPIPKKMDITTYDAGEVTAKINIKLKNPKFLKPEKIGKKTFMRPSPKGFKSIFKMNDDCKFVEQ